MADACMIPAQLWVLALAPRVDQMPSSAVPNPPSYSAAGVPSQGRLCASIILARASSGYGLASHCWSTSPTHHHHPPLNSCPPAHCPMQLLACTAIIKSRVAALVRASVLVSPHPNPTLSTAVGQGICMPGRLVICSAEDKKLINPNCILTCLVLWS